MGVLLCSVLVSGRELDSSKTFATITIVTIVTIDVMMMEGLVINFKTEGKARVVHVS